MLILERKTNEEIVIDGHIVVCVLGVRGDRVRIGVEAPKDVAVNRREIHDELVRQWGGQGA